MRILYRVTGQDEFDFLIPPPKRADERAAYAPDGEVRGVARIENGALIIRDLTVSRERGLNGQSLRAVPLGEIRDQMMADLRERPGLLEAARGDVFVRPGVARLSARASKVETLQLEIAARQLRDLTPLRGKPNDDFYRAVAVAYVFASHIRPRDPVAALTTELRNYKLHSRLSPNTVMGWVRKSRAMGWLTPAVHGRPGADFGERWRQEHRQPKEV